MQCESESLNDLLSIDFNLYIMMRGPLLAKSQKSAVQHLLLRFKIYSIKLQHSYLFADHC